MNWGTCRRLTPRRVPVLSPRPEAPLYHVVDGGDVIAVGADLDAGWLLHAYSQGFFPMPVAVEPSSGVSDAQARANARPDELGWWCPHERGILRPADVRVSKSLRRALPMFEVRVNTAFAEVVAGCAESNRPHGWITADIASAYQQLHELGWAHSVECWRDGQLVGGLYGVCLRGLFAGESMFHRVTDASKVALVALALLLTEDGQSQRIIDVQWVTPHLQTLGAVAVSRSQYDEIRGFALGVSSPEGLVTR